MEPVLTLPQSPVCYASRSPIKSKPQETTPKLPRRERLASFSRLIGSENALDLASIRSKLEGRRIRKLKEISSNSACQPDIRVHSPSPNSKEPVIEGGDCLTPSSRRCLDSKLFPFSPIISNCKSPSYYSPSYKQPSPTSSPLYSTPERRKSFLGRGSFGNVTLCSYKGSQFAVKVIQASGTEVGENNFLGIRHPHLVTILHVTQIQDKVFVCMTFAGHCNLQQVLDTKSELDFPRRLSFCVQIASGLRHCHLHRLVHGDVKPANVIVSARGHCKLGDFGQSLREGEGGDGQIVGTTPYAAPEVLRGQRPTSAADIYSFGVLLWQVRTREFPFAGEHPHVIIYKVANYGCRPTFLLSDSDEVIKSFANTVQSCWRENPSERPSAAEALNLLQNIVQSTKQQNKKLSKEL